MFERDRVGHKLWGLQKTCYCLPWADVKGCLWSEWRFKFKAGC